MSLRLCLDSAGTAKAATRAMLTNGMSGNSVKGAERNKIVTPRKFSDARKSIE